MTFLEALDMAVRNPGSQLRAKSWDEDLAVYIEEDNGLHMVECGSRWHPLVESLQDDWEVLAWTDEYVDGEGEEPEPPKTMQDLLDEHFKKENGQPYQPIPRSPGTWDSTPWGYKVTTTTKEFNDD